MQWISEKENPPEKSTQNKNIHLNKFFLNNFRWVPDSRHREEGKSSRERFEKVRVNAPFFGISGFWVGFWACRISQAAQISQPLLLGQTWNQNPKPLYPETGITLSIFL